METTPSSNRIHIGIFGRCNSGKSSLLNALAGQSAALVSEFAGTTTDPVNKPMELPGLGAVVVTDTAGFDDRTPLGAARLKQTLRVARQSDIAVIVCASTDCGPEAEWAERFRRRGVAVVAVLNERGSACDEKARDALARRMGAPAVCVCAASGRGIGALTAALAAAIPADDGATITGELAAAGDTVLLVMPQDAAAPKGRLILPQTQTLHELLDKGCTAVCCTPQRMQHTLETLSGPPRLIVTDSQAFAAVSALAPPESLLTSFSVLYAGYKGLPGALAEGAAAIGRLHAASRVLIAEACAHAPAEEDIGRVKLPRLLRARAGEGVRIEFVSGADFPEDLTPYDLVVHCGGCMFNRRHMLARIAQAAEQGVPLTNYGFAIACLTGILDRIVYPGKGGER